MVAAGRGKCARNEDSDGPPEALNIDADESITACLLKNALNRGFHDSSGGNPIGSYGSCSNRPSVSASAGSSLRSG